MLRENVPFTVAGKGTIGFGLGAVWVADADGSLYRLDAVTNEVSATSVGTPLTAVAVDEADGIVWATTGEAS